MRLFTVKLRLSFDAINTGLPSLFRPNAIFCLNSALLLKAEGVGLTRTKYSAFSNRGSVASTPAGREQGGRAIAPVTEGQVRSATARGGSRLWRCLFASLNSRPFFSLPQITRIRVSAKFKRRRT